jgi:hypothetical protein
MLTVQPLAASLLAVVLVSGCGSSSTSFNARDGSWAHDGEDVDWTKLEPRDAPTAIGRDARVELRGSPDARGRLVAGTEAATNPRGKLEWVRVCIEQLQGWDEVEQAPPTQGCLYGERVVSVKVARVASTPLESPPWTGESPPRKAKRHPGTAPMIVGGVFLGIAGILAVAALTEDDSDGGRPADCSTDCYSEIDKQSLGLGLAGLVAVPGVILETYGVIRYSTSSSRHSRSNFAPPPPRQSAKGVRVGFEF